MKKLLLSLIIITSASSLYGMETHEQSALLAEEYNMLHCPFMQLPSEMLLHIFSHCVKNHGENYPSEESFTKSSEIFLELSKTCKFFNKLLTLKRIGSFYKDYDQDYKDYILQAFIGGRYSKIRLPALIILHAGADVEMMSALHTFLERAVFNNDEQAVEICFSYHANPNTKIYPNHRFEKEDNPLFFYAKTKQIASIFIDNSVDIHQKSPISKTNILWHIVSNNYPAELLQFYLEKGVDAEQLDPSNNFCLLHRIVSKYFNSQSLHHMNEDDINNLLVISKYLLSSIPRMINAVDIYGKTPITLAQENLTNTKLGFDIWLQMTSSQIYKTDEQKIIAAIETLTTLFENTAQELEQKTAQTI